MDGKSSCTKEEEIKENNKICTWDNGSKKGERQKKTDTERFRKEDKVPKWQRKHERKWKTERKERGGGVLKGASSVHYEG